MAVSIQFQQRLPFVDRDGRLTNDGLRALNSLAAQIQQIAELYDITGLLASDLAGIAAAPVITSGATDAFANERILGATTPISVFYAPGTATVAFTGYTDDVPEGVTNLYFTQARARLSINGSTTVSYNNSTGVISLNATNVANALGYTPYDAANPAGYITGGGSSSLNIRTITATAAPAANDYTLLCNAASGAITVNLPAAASSAKRVLSIKKIDATANAVTIDPNGAELIDGAATMAITTQWQAMTIHCDGTAWFLI